MEGKGRWARYHFPRVVNLQMRDGAGVPRGSIRLTVVPALTAPGIEIRNHVRQPREARTPVGYNRELVDSYRPNDTFYLSEDQRAHLRETGRALADEQPAGTYAMKVLNRLLIDLSWNSSRLEGNTYSLLDAARLIELGEEAEEKDRLEAQMILNHKDAIGFLVNAAEDVGFNRYTILNLHALLADNLLPDPAAAGRLRQIAVGIGGSVFHPLEVPQLIEECFDQVLATASAINDPFEQGLFAMVHLPYLQPFEDVNKRVSRLAANIPLIKHNLSPLSFDDVPRELYTQAVLGVYELNRAELLRDVFCSAYQRSAARYAAVRQSLGEPDPFRMRHRSALRELVAEVVRERMNKKEARCVSMRGHENASATKSVNDSSSWPKGSFSHCTMATSRGMGSGRPSSLPGRRGGTPEGRNRSTPQASGAVMTHAWSRVQSRHPLRSRNPSLGTPDSAENANLAENVGAPDRTCWRARPGSNRRPSFSATVRKLPI